MNKDCSASALGDAKKNLTMNTKFTYAQSTVTDNDLTDRLKQVKFLMANATEGHFPDDNLHRRTKSRTRSGYVESTVTYRNLKLRLGFSLHFLFETSWRSSTPYKLQVLLIT